MFTLSCYKWRLKGKGSAKKVNKMMFSHSGKMHLFLFFLDVSGQISLSWPHSASLRIRVRCAMFDFISCRLV